MPFCGMRSFSVAIFACETKQVPGKGESFRWGDLGWDSQDASVDNCTTILLATKTHPKPPSKLMSAFTPPFHGISRYHRGKCQLITEVTSWSRSSDLRIRHKTNSRRHPKWKEIQYWFKRWYHTQLIFVFGKVKWMTWDFFFPGKNTSIKLSFLLTEASDLPPKESHQTGRTQRSSGSCQEGRDF